MQVDPDHRWVVDSLEAEWNQALRALAAAKERYEKQRQADRAGLDEEQRAAIMALATDFPRLWNDPHTPQRERKRMARLLIADVTLLKASDVRAEVRFHGGATHTLTLALPKSAWMLRQTSAAAIAEIDQLLDEHTGREIAELLNRQGMISGEGKRLDHMMVARIRDNYGLESRYSRLRARGLLTLNEIAAYLDVATATVKNWRRAGLLRAYRYDDKGQCLFEQPGAGAPTKYAYQRKTRGKSASSEASANPPQLSRCTVQRNPFARVIVERSVDLGCPSREYAGRMRRRRPNLDRVGYLVDPFPCAGLNDLSGDPLGSRMRRHAQPQNAASIMAHDQQALEEPERNRRNDKEVHRGDAISMVAKKRPPTLRRRSPAPRHILRHAHLADVDAELQKLCGRRRGRGILIAVTADGDAHDNPCEQ